MKKVAIYMTLAMLGLGIGAMVVFHVLFIVFVIPRGGLI
jgi:hypothetical protein